MTARSIAQVIVCAGGLGTRVAPWARHIPKEFQPVNGKPGFLHLLDELTALLPARVVVVYHPYYGQFIEWIKTTLRPGGQAGYQRAAAFPRTDPPLHEQVDLRFIPQRGRYADVTSVLNGADHLRTHDDLIVVFADNLYRSGNPSLRLAAVPAGHAAVLVRPYLAAEAGRRGVIVSQRVNGDLVFVDLVEKPGPDRARELEDHHGSPNLWLLEGRVRLTRRLVDQLRRTSLGPGIEPKLSLAIRRFAAEESVYLIPALTTVTDLGSPAHSDFIDGFRPAAVLGR